MEHGTLIINNLTHPPLKIRGGERRGYERSIKEALIRVARFARCSQNAVASVIFVNDAKMRQLNRKYRGKDKTTNVLAFATNKSLALLGLTKLSFDSRDLGDIFISLPEARREAKKYGWTINYEIARLTAHGFLHLLGYDHKLMREALAMEKMEKLILQQYKHSNSKMIKSQ